MSKICTNCGNQMDDATMFCTNCGAPVPTTAPTAPAAEPAKKVDVAGMVKDAKKDPKKLITLGAIAAVALIAVIVIVVSLFANPWKKGLNNYCDLLEGKKAAVTKNIPAAAYEWLDDEYGVEKKTISSNAKDIAKDLSEDASDEYGEGYKITYKVEKSKRFTKKMRANLADGIENTYDIDAKKVTDAYVVEGTVDISGKDSFEWYETSYIVAKIGGQWYVVSSYGGEGKEAYATLAGLSNIVHTETFQDEIDK